MSTQDGWLSFCQDYKIDYRRGSAGRNIEIHCAMCGLSDKSHHLGLSLTSSKYGCWRNKQHRGRNPVRVIKLLLGCDWENAKTIAESYFEGSVISTEVKKRCQNFNAVNPPVDFMPFDGKMRVENQFQQFLIDRGVAPSWAISRFGLQWSISGESRYRIVIPITIYGALMTWVARSISNNVRPKYIAGKAPETPHKSSDFLFDYDNLSGGRMLVVCEGAFDAIKVASCMQPGVHATALFGTSLSDHQMNLLIDLSDRYEYIVVVLDRDAQHEAQKLVDQLRWYVDNVSRYAPIEKDFGTPPTFALTLELKQLIGKLDGKSHNKNSREMEKL